MGPLSGSDEHSVAAAVYGKSSFDGSETPGTEPHDISQYQFQAKATESEKGDVGAESDAESEAESEKTPPELLRELMLTQPTDEQLTKERLNRRQALEELERLCTQMLQSGEKLQILVEAHKMLLKKHHDHFLASRLLLARQMVKDDDLDEMPARIWTRAIHPLLELLREKLPDSQEDLTNYLLFSYSMVTDFLEKAPRFEDIWMECLGDLARYLMGINGSGALNHEDWKEASRGWYNRIAARHPDNGRIQHHLGVLARPNDLQQFFYFSKALISGKPSLNSRESMKSGLFAPDRNMPTAWLTLTGLFIAAHRALFNQAPTEFFTRANEFLSALPSKIDQLSLQGEQGDQGQLGLQMTCCNIAVISQYLTQAGIETTHFEASSFAFDTLSIMLNGVNHPAMYPSVHVALAFVYCLTFNSAAIQQLESLIPWTKLADYLNHLFRLEIGVPKIERPSFPHFEDGNAQRLPEDFSMSGQRWTKPYYPEGFFQGAPPEEERPCVEKPEMVIHRRIRCLWLGVRIATASRCIIYDRRQGFVPLSLISS